MERLSYIDEHARSVDANRHRTWKALLKAVCQDAADPVEPTGFVLASAEELSHREIYRALVIVRGGHKPVVRGMLRRIAAAA